jgi:hypothetical protein
MIILTKDVIIITKDGSKVSAVIRTSTCKVKLYSVPAASWVTLSTGNPCCAKIIEEKSMEKKKRKIFERRFILIILANVFMDFSNMKVFK